MSQKSLSFNLPRALYMADSYMRMADREIDELQSLDESEFKEKMAGSNCLAISSLAFSLEIYFKSILYCGDEEARSGHNLEKLWNKLPKGIKTWFTAYFDNNYKPIDKDWSVMLLFSPSLRDASVEVTTPDSTALGMIKGHRNAFAVGRYGYEQPKSQEVKPIVYNLAGLQLLSWLARELAHHVVGELQKVKEAKKGESGHYSEYITLPNSPIKRFPPKE